MEANDNELEEFSCKSIKEHLEKNILNYSAYIVHGLTKDNVINSRFEKAKSDHCKFVFNSVDTYTFENNYILRIKNGIV